MSSTATTDTGWTDNGTDVNLTTSTDNVGIGGSSLGKLSVDGDTDEIQLLAQGNATQTTNLFVLENSAATDQFTVGNTGNTAVNGTLTVTGAGNQSTITEGLIVNNGVGTDADDDFQVKGGTVTGLLYADVSADRVGVGVTTPEALFEVQGAEATDAVLVLDADDGDDAADTWTVESEAADNDLSVLNGTTEVVNVTSAGAMTITTINTGLGAVELAAGVWTPTSNNIQNLASSSAAEGQYLRVGATVTGSILLTVDPTLATTTTELELDLPVASNFGATSDAAGSCGGDDVVSEVAGIRADATSDELEVLWVTTSLASHEISCSFSYQII